MKAFARITTRSGQRVQNGFQCLSADVCILQSCDGTISRSHVSKNARKADWPARCNPRKQTMKAVPTNKGARKRKRGRRPPWRRSPSRAMNVLKSAAVAAGHVRKVENVRELIRLMMLDAYHLPEGRRSKGCERISRCSTHRSRT